MEPQTTFGQQFSALMHSKKFWIVVASVVILGVAAAYIAIRLGKGQPIIPSKNAEANCATNGLATTKDKAQRRPLAVMVENEVQARPQTGIGQGEVVYEAPTEGGITRYMLIFQCTDASILGPVRSARTYYVDWLQGYKAIYAHVGGNANAMEQIKADDVLDLDQFQYMQPYKREASRPAPHNVYASTATLRDAAVKDADISPNAQIQSWKFKEDTANASGTSAKNITVNFSGKNYQVKYVYDPTTNSYQRSVAGQADKDAETKKQVQPKVVVIMYTKQWPIPNDPENGIAMDDIGSGKAIIFQDGAATEGTWQKDSKSERERYFDQSGKEIEFNRGQIWISAVPDSKTVEYN